MAAPSSILAWRIPWTEKLEGTLLWCCKESDTTEQLTNALCIYVYIHIVYVNFYLGGYSRCLPPPGKVLGMGGEDTRV